MLKSSDSEKNKPWMKIVNEDGVPRDATLAAYGICKSNA